jgi:hypothetical protein
LCIRGLHGLSDRQRGFQLSGTELRMKLVDGDTVSRKALRDGGKVPARAGQRRESVGGLLVNGLVISNAFGIPLELKRSLQIETLPRQLIELSAKKMP